MPSRGGRRSSTHHSSVALEDVSMQSSHYGDASVGLDDPKYVLASSLLATMMREVIIDNAMLAHRNITRQRRAQGEWPGGCAVCKTSCLAPAEGSRTTQASTDTLKTEGEVASSTQALSSAGATTAATGASAQPKGLEIYHNNPLLACLVCSRQVSANRYAQHLASCVGVGKGGAARRKGKNAGSSKIKMALENRKRAGYLMSGASTPIQKSIDDVASDDENGRRPQKLFASSSLGLNSNGKRSASPIDGAETKKQRSSTPPTHVVDGTVRNAQSYFGASALAASQPPTGSPLNPHRSGKVNGGLAEGNGRRDGGHTDDEEDNEDDDDDDDDDDDESVVALSRAPVRSKLGQTSSVLSGGDDDGSDFYDDGSASEGRPDNNIGNISDDGSYVQSKRKGLDRSDTPSVQSDADDDF